MKEVDVVGAVIRNDKGEVLCALRSPAMSQAGLWEFPGGKLEPGEDPKEALMREIAEELACTVAVDDLIADTTHCYPQVIVRLRTYGARIVTGTPEAKEHAELRWVRPEALRDLAWAPADLPTVEQLIRG